MWVLSFFSYFRPIDDIYSVVEFSAGDTNRVDSFGKMRLVSSCLFHAVGINALLI